MIQFDEHIFQVGWFNHQLDLYWMQYRWTLQLLQVIYLEMHASKSTQFKGVPAKPLIDFQSITI